MAHTFLLASELTIFTMGDLYPQMLKWLTPAESEGPVESAEQLRLDASGVAEVDGAGVQLLMSLANSLGRRGRQLVLTDPSAALVSACATLGATPLLKDDA